MTENTVLNLQVSGKQRKKCLKIKSRAKQQQLMTHLKKRPGEHTRRLFAELTEEVLKAHFKRSHFQYQSRGGYSEDIFSLYRSTGLEMVFTRMPCRLVILITSQTALMRSMSLRK